MDLKEYFLSKEEMEHLQKETKHSSLSPWLFILEKTAYGFIRLLMVLVLPFVRLFEKLADLLKTHTSYKQRDLFETSTKLSIQSKKFKNGFKKVLKILKEVFFYLKRDFKSPTFAFIHDVSISVLSIPVALYITGNYSLETYPFSFIVYESSLFILSTLAVFFLFGFYETEYRPPLLPDILDHTKIVFFSMVTYMPLYCLTGAYTEFPPSFLVILALIFFSGLLLPRLFYVMWKERYPLFQKNLPSLEEKSKLKKILIVGSASETLEACRALDESNTSYKVLGLVQEKPAFETAMERPIEILGKINELESILEGLIEYNNLPEEIWITEFHPDSKLLSHVLSKGNKHGIVVKKLVSLPSSHRTTTQIGGYRSLVLEDFFPSFTPAFDGDLLRDFVEGTRFLITGAAGSLGTAVVQKIAFLNPKHITLIDHAEGNLFKLEVELAKKFPNLSHSSYLCDVADYTLLSQIIGHERPEYIFHLAGIKQVSFAEINPNQAVRTNIIGSKNVAELACRYEVKKVIFPSVLQAHNPRNVLEATKRISEGYIQYLMEQERHKEGANGKRGTQFCIVRLENILGSSGSVASLFREDFHQHKEIIITHPEMCRSFVSLRDAALFLLTTAAVQEESLSNPENLSEIRTHPPLKIMDLAQYLALLAGYTLEKEIKFKIKGLRPGEYIISLNESNKPILKETSFPGVYIATQPLYNDVVLIRALKELEEESSKGHTAQILYLLHYLAPSFNPGRD